MAREGKGGDDQRDETRDTTAGTEREATETEREGMDLLGGSSVRDGSIGGVSDPSARSDQRAEGVDTRGAGTGPRRNPPEDPTLTREDEDGSSL